MGYQAHCVVMEEISRASGKDYLILIQEYCEMIDFNMAFLYREYRSLLRRPLSTLRQPTIFEWLRRTKGTILARSALR